MRCVIFDSFTFLLLYYSTSGYMRGGEGQKKGGDPWPWLRRQWRNYAGVKTRMAATRHPPLTNSFFFILKVISIKIVYGSLNCRRICQFSFFHPQDLTAVRILVGSHGLGGRCESSLFCLSKLWLNLVTTLDTFFEYIQFSVLLQCQHIVISLNSNWQSHDLFTHSCFVATSSTNGVEEASS